MDDPKKTTPSPTTYGPHEAPDVTASPNQRVQLAGHRLEHIIARNVTAALEHLVRESTILDGWAAKGESAGRSSDPTSTTESAALMRYHIRSMVEDVRDAIDGVEIAVGHLARITETAAGTRAPCTVLRCRDNQHGGRKGTIEWGVPDCEEIPVKAGLCSACYQRERRWRVANGLPTRETEEAA